MKFEFFRVPALDGAVEQAALNRFLQSHRIADTRVEFVDEGPSSAWCVCVTWVEEPAETGRRAASVDYKAELSPEDFDVFARLRDIRKTLAQREGLATYAVFTNAQLAEMVRSRVTTKAGLARISGVGESRVSRYGDAVLEELNRAFEKASEQDAGSAAPETTPGEGT